ncbi:MAG TPA: ABC transporter substrate-binding protein [Spirochaetia bacterium]|nr:ABC transporter substrate-binding protein [Spirochaetia bacterium]
MRLITLIFTALLLCCIGSCGDDSDAPATVTILVPEAIGSLPFLLFAEQTSPGGVRLNIVFFTGHPQALILLLQGQADFLFTGTTLGWQSMWDGSPLVAVESYVWGISSLLVQHEGPASIRDLSGMRLSLPFRDSPLDLETRFLLDRAGVKNTAVTLEYRPFAQGIPLFLEGNIDAIALPEPLATDLVHTHHVRRLFNYRNALRMAAGTDGRSPEVTLFSTRDKATKYSRLIPLLHDGLARIIDSMAADPEGTAAAAGRHFNYPPAILEEAIRETSFGSCSFQEHMSRMREYHRLIGPYFHTPPGPLPDTFFFIPEEKETGTDG